MITPSPELHRYHLLHGETDMWLYCDRPDRFEAAEAAVIQARSELQRYLSKDPYYWATIEPLEVVEPFSAPLIVRRMAGAAAATGIGPMGSVAGAIAEVAVEVMLSVPANPDPSFEPVRIAIADNGGDIQLDGSPPWPRPVHVAVGAPGSDLSEHLAFRVRSDRLPLAICTSAGKSGHSISFGDAHAAVAVGASATLADAAATAIANEVRASDPEGSLRRALRKAEGIEGLHGAFIIIGALVGRTGRLPELVWVDEE